MNRAERRRRQKEAKKAAKGTAPGQALDIPKTLDAAVKHHSAGRLPRAEQLYQQVLQADPDQPVALNLLGVIARQRGDHAGAVDLITKALAIKPDMAEAHNNLGNTLLDLGKTDKAIASYRQALEFKPDFTDALNNLGTALKDLGQLDEAAELFAKALDLQPESAAMHCNFGAVLKNLGRLEDAVESFQKALSIQPDLTAAHNNLGATFKDLGWLDDAIDSYNKALAIDPEIAEIHNNLGAVFKEQEKLEAAVASYEKALTIKPDYIEAHYNLGNALQLLGHFDDSVESYRRTLALKPDYADAHNNLGAVYKNQGLLDDAIACYRTALGIDPDFSGAERSLLFTLMNLPGLSPEDLFEKHRRFAAKHERTIAPFSGDWGNDPDPDRRLRIGYLSSDLKDHPVGKNVLPLLSAHDKEKFEVYCYADVPQPDAVTEHIQSITDLWRDIAGTADADVAGMIRADTIDVLVCLAGHFDSNRPLVSAHRAAPVQVSFHDGATSGLKEMDYWLTDEFLHPPDSKEQFTEDLYRLPVFYQYPAIEDAPPVSPLPAGAAGFITFGSLNNPAKVNEEVISLWAEVLKSVPNSRLLLKYKNWYGEGSLKDRMAGEFAALGLDRDRIQFAAAHDTFAEHLGRYADIDVALDPFPFNGATTTYQALSMGVPVVSLKGETFISRAAGSLLHHVGLGELAVATPEAYVAAAQELAGDLERLKMLRAGLPDQVAGSPLCDAPAYARSIEDAYRAMWRTWCAGVPKI